jgi:hypothetical protein
MKKWANELSRVVFLKEFQMGKNHMIFVSHQKYTMEKRYPFQHLGKLDIF